MPKVSEKEKQFKPLDRLYKKLRTDNLWIWILKLLTENESKYAYELRLEIKNRFGFEPATVTNYAVLYRLEKSGYVEEVNATLQPNRKYYRITEKGREVFAEAKKMLQNTYTQIFDEEIN